MNALKETKKKHLLAILKYLYLHNSSTMNELVGNLQLSQPSIRNMVRILQEKQLIQEVGNDLSSGGRCPTRFALNEKNYLILCLYIQVDKIIYQVRGFSEIKKEDTLFYQGEEELKKIIRQLVDKNEVHCCQIAVEGIVYEDEYVTDHQNILKKHHWVKDIKKEIDLSKFPKINKWIEISALSKIGIDNLEDQIYKYIMNENVEDSSQKLVITNVRHKSALEKTNEALLNIIETIDMGLPMDLMAVDIKDALDSLSEVTGEISSEDLLDHIFSNFCVGK